MWFCRGMDTVFQFIIFCVYNKSGSVFFLLGECFSLPLLCQVPEIASIL